MLLNNPDNFPSALTCSSWHIHTHALWLTLAQETVNGLQLTLAQDTVNEMQMQLAFAQETTYEMQLTLA